MNVRTATRATRWVDGSTYHPRIDDVLRELVAPQNAVVNHEVYGRLDSLERTRTFMEHHVFAVLDFMWLLKSLQRALTCVESHWIPVGNPAARRFINEIVLEEESDTHLDGWTSHFELYLAGMRQAGADTGPVSRFVDAVRARVDPALALRQCGAPPAARAFFTNTFDIVTRNRPHELAGAFAFGRENLIPSMFTALAALERRVPDRVGILLDYLERHIALDGEHHTPLAFGMVAEVCGDDDRRWAAVLDTARRSLRARVALWDGVVETMEQRRSA